VWFKPTKQANGSFEVKINEQIIAQMPSGGTFVDQTCFPYLDNYPKNYKKLPDAMRMVLWAALVHSPWDHSNEADFWQQLRERTLKLRHYSDRALMIVCGCNLFEWGTFLRRMDNFLMDLIADQVNVEALLDALMQIHLDTLKRVCP
jgi:uroporphyrinogen decarboxylase